MTNDTKDAKTIIDSREHTEAQSAARHRISDSGVRAMQGQDEAGEVSGALRAMENIKPGAWNRMDEQERLNTLQSVETTQASIQSRPAADISAYEGPNSSYAYYDPGKNQIKVNGAWVRSDDVRENVDSVVHEGRHAYQQFAIENPGVHDNAAEVALWDYNMKNYLDAETYGQRAYENQPIERDARQYAQTITDGVYGLGVS